MSHPTLEIMHNLSKSPFTKYLKCPKSLWLYKHAPELRSEIDATQQAIMDQGTYVGELAQELFPCGVIHLEDIPYDHKLTAPQKLQVDTHKSGEPYISKRALEQFLVTIEHPVSYLDFETFSDAVPRFDGQKVYQQIPFQYSLHIVEENGAEPLHREFLAPEGEDPRRLFAEALLRDLPATGSIVVYNQSFEKRIIREVAKLFDDLSDDLLALNSRVVDLLVPFQSGAYYHPKSKGFEAVKLRKSIVIPYKIAQKSSASPLPTVCCLCSILPASTKCS